MSRIRTLARRSGDKNNYSTQNGLLPFSDGFAADGALASGWIGDTWSASGGEALNTPPQTNLLTNPGLENWSSPTNLDWWIETLEGTSTINQESTEVNNGTYAMRIDTDGSSSPSRIFRSGITTSIGFQERGAYGKCNSTPAQFRFDFSGRLINLTTAYARYFDTHWEPDTGVNMNVIPGTAVNKSIYADDVSLYHIALTDALALRQTGASDVYCGVAVQVIVGTFAGVAICVDNPESPANLLLAYHNGINLYLDKIVSGVRTNLITNATAYVSGGVVEIRKSGSDVELYYQGVQVGSTQDLSSETGIISNTYHGMLSTNTGNRLDDFFVTPPA